MSDVLASLAEPNRRRLLQLLRGGERTVTELASHFPVTRPAVSRHLGVLAEAGLVDVRREGRYRYYRLNPTGMAMLGAALDAFWTTELEHLAEPFMKGSAMSIEKSVVVPLDPEQTFALLTEPERLRRWQAMSARVDLRAGGEYRWTVIPGNNAGGTFTEVEPGRRVVFTWAWEGPDGSPPRGDQGPACP
jgi:DNA-binding transcriptional ArsR family regulator